jgi:Phosphodiester glycosidase
LLFAVCLSCPPAASGGDESSAPAKPERYFSYTNDMVPEAPWSIHVAKIDLARSELRLATTLGNGETLGMSTVTEQLDTLPPGWGLPLAAINGDFYEKGEDYAGRPRDVQIREGEIVSHPAGHSCFWIDPQGRPRMTNVYSRFEVSWPDGKSTSIGLNAERADDAAMLYSAVIGATTATRGGVEYTLEGTPGSAWLPLQAGQLYEARVRSVRNSGNAPLDHETVVLSIGPDLVAKLPALSTGATVRISTGTVPDLAGVQTAIGGGPALVVDGKVMQWSGWIHVRHPRSAVGWNEKSLFLVEVDGRQMDLSVGMTFSELAAYMLKLGCQEALNFDGGGSATLWALGSVRNSPSEGQERPCPNTLVVLKKTPQPADK